jgi:hypothetical protein
MVDCFRQRLWQVHSCAAGVYARAMERVDCTRCLLHSSQLDFVRLGGEAQSQGHTYEAMGWNILRFAVWRGTLINAPRSRSGDGRQRWRH